MAGCAAGEAPWMIIRLKANKLAARITQVAGVPLRSGHRGASPVGTFPAHQAPVPAGPRSPSFPPIVGQSIKFSKILIKPLEVSIKSPSLGNCSHRHTLP